MVLGRPDEYPRAKKLFDAGRHPTFIGPDMVARHASTGGLLFATWEGADVAVALMNVRRSVLLVLTVVPACQGYGLGDAIVRYVAPIWVRVIEANVPWFERRGFEAVGALKQGRTLRTQIMVHSDVRRLAGRVAESFGDRVANGEDAEHSAARDGGV